jgi:beta-phosphoglucomutase-like phosphatase (HAD superfamily)
VTAVLCDADGCLFPSEEPAFEASSRVTNELLGEIGSRLRFSGEELRRSTTGLNFRATAASLARGAGRPLTAAELEGWVEAERCEVTEHLGRALRPDPGVLEPLGRLGRERVLAVVSSSALSRIEACLVATALGDLFPHEARFSAEDSLPAPSSKPDPAVYLLAGERLGVGPGEAVAIEDSVPGAEAAIAAGFPTFGNLAFVPAAEQADRIGALERAGVARIVFSWEEVERLLGRPR